MPSVRFNSGFYKKMDAIVTMSSRKALADLSKKTAHWGVRDQGDLALIMGVLEFGDPDHRFPNIPTGKLAPIPPRRWLKRSTEGYYQKELANYVNKNLPKVLAGFPKRGQGITNQVTRKSADEFIQGLAEVGRDNARKSWELANFTENSPATLANKRDPRPLHDTGRMNESVITAWSE